MIITEVVKDCFPPFIVLLKDSTAWANLGMLYLQNEDFDLAQQAFTSAQYVDPECCLSWFGQVLIAWRKDGLLNRDALFELLEHTMDVGGSSLVSNSFVLAAHKVYKFTLCLLVSNL